MRIFNKLTILLLLVSFWLIPFTNANYQDTETSVGNLFTAGCWSAPSIPVHQTPADNDYFNGLTPTFDWLESSFICPNATAQYQFQVFTDSSLVNQYHQSTWLSASEYDLSGMPDGEYWWQVRSQDSQGYISSWSTAWKLTLDRVAPSTQLSFNGYSINETVTNGDFEAGLAGWTTQGKVVYKNSTTDTSPYSGSGMVKIGHNNATSGYEIWENKLSQQLSPGAKNLSFYYNFFSYEDNVFYDDPGMVVRLNDYNVFYLSAGDIENGASPNTSGWTQLSFDISQITDPVLEIIFYSGNTDDEYNQSWVYIDDVSTSEAVAYGSSLFNLSAVDNLSGVADIQYSFNGTTWSSGSTFDLSTITGSTLVYYRSIDLAGNTEAINTRRLVKDSQAPEAINNLDADYISKQEIELSWTVPNDSPDNISPTIYDIRYSTLPISSEVIFATASSVLNPPAPRLVGEDQYFTVSGLDSDTTYYFAIKSADAALNWSTISNIANDTTLSHAVDNLVNAGDVVINELMWMGSLGHSDDEWLELRNMTDQDITLSGWQLTKWVAGNHEELMLTIPDGEIIPANGYYLISNFNKANSRIKVDPDLVDINVAIKNTDLQIKLYDGDWLTTGIEIDIADNALGEPSAGQYDLTAGIYSSMERDATPGDGTQASSWHTIFDNTAETQAYWDDGGPEKGTPGGRNLSQATPIKSLDLTLNNDQTQADFMLIDPDLSKFETLEYLLTYDSLSGPQGIKGSREIKNQPESIEVQDLILGTCSTNGTCVYHQKVQNFNLVVTLKGLIERTYETNL